MMDDQRFRIVAKRRADVDGELIAIALLKIVESLDATARAQLAKEGTAIAKRLDQKEGGDGNAETAA